MIYKYRVSLSFVSTYILFHEIKRIENDIQLYRNYFTQTHNVYKSPPNEIIQKNHFSFDRIQEIFFLS